METVATDVSWHIVVNIHGKKIIVACGDATQRVKWLASVAIANFDTEHHQGYKVLGIPTSVRDAQHLVEMGSQIRDVLQDGDEGEWGQKCQFSDWCTIEVLSTSHLFCSFPHSVGTDLVTTI